MGKIFEHVRIPIGKMKKVTKKDDFFFKNCLINIQEKYPKPSSLIIVKKIGISVKMNRKLFHCV